MNYRYPKTDGPALHRQRRRSALGLRRSKHYHSVISDILAELKTHRVTALSVADLVTPPSLSRMIAAELPYAELAVASESGHSVYWEQPDVFNRAVLDFVGKHSK